MFSKLVASLFLVTAFTSGVISKPITLTRGLSLRTDSHSFNNWGGHTSLDHFDDFYGSDNFDGSHVSQVIVHDQEVVCHSQQVEIIQQRLVVLQEMAKRIITEQICEVETQTIVFEQFHSSLGGFSSDLRRNSGHQVGFDHNIASHFGSIVDSDGALTSGDLGFSGHDVGSQTVVVDGSNWNDQTSPATVNDAFSQARDAFSALHPDQS
ncbi:hypothetical protein BDZ94DRAFT_1322073 [Collybia nuda]|uniref:Uncharacterized protein n=1 Tax=Collybia nuda TaxID=64659 RepID=A0A9P5Y890_9AGAR|nr:hypothetical protein BDZ94DRAFT_1322073 [Collybia nuda]